MRGTIEVSGPNTAREPVRQPLYTSLGLNIDADHRASVTPSQMPSAWRGALLDRAIPQAYSSREYYLSHTPVDLWLSLRVEPTNLDLSDQQVWDLVAWVWQSNTTPAQVLAGKQLFGSNCAACHGERGAGNGVYADSLAAGPAASTQATGEHTQRPADFSDPSRMLSASPAHLQGKLIRGGMGTGMPSWGAIFTEDQTWALIAYLWSFQFQMEANP
jgi:mono/diheme cytochrome c family protein